jgi:transposase-like protein
MLNGGERVVDLDDDVPGVLLQERRDATAARRFFGHLQRPLIGRSPTGESR